MLKRAYEYLATYGLLAILAVMIIGWTVPVLILLGPLPKRWRRRAARYTMMVGLRLFLRMLTAAGACEIDVEAVDTLRGGPPVILAANHPTSIDALLLLARLPDLACILKPELMANPFLGAGARLAGFIRSDPPRRMIREAVAELRRGGLVLLFPEGTRTTRAPLNALKGSAEVIARHARVPIQVAIIETDSPYLSKGWPIFKVPRLPIRFRVRLGSRLEPAAEGTGDTQMLEQELTHELAGAPQNGWLGRADAFKRGHLTCPRSGERPRTEARAGGPATKDGQWHDPPLPSSEHPPGPVRAGAPATRDGQWHDPPLPSGERPPGPVQAGTPATRDGQWHD